MQSDKSAQIYEKMDFAHAELLDLARAIERRFASNPKIGCKYKRKKSLLF
jgi:hypothetical protein